MKKEKKKKTETQNQFFCLSFTLQLTGCLLASTAEKGGRESELWEEKGARERKEE